MPNVFDFAPFGPPFNGGFTGRVLDPGGDQLHAQFREGGLNRRFQGNQAGLERGAENYRAQLASQTQEYLGNLQNSRFNRVFSALHHALGGFGFGGGGQVGPAGGSPEISVGPIWTPQQIQQQVNQQRARNDVGTGTELKRISQDVAGRGFATGSPLQQALNQQTQMSNLIANTQAGTQIPWQAAQGNAAQVLATQQARESQFAARQQEAIERARVQSQYATGIASSLSGLLR